LNRNPEDLPKLHISSEFLLEKETARHLAVMLSLQFRIKIFFEKLDLKPSQAVLHHLRRLTLPRLSSQCFAL